MTDITSYIKKATNVFQRLDDLVNNYEDQLEPYQRQRFKTAQRLNPFGNWNPMNSRNRSIRRKVQNIPFVRKQLQKYGINPVKQKGPNRKRRTNKVRKATVIAPKTRVSQQMGMIAKPDQLGTVIHPGFKTTDSGIYGMSRLDADLINQNYAVVPICPLLYEGRLQQEAKLYGQFRINRATVYYIPLQGTSTPGMIAMCQKNDCSPLQRENSVYTQIESIATIVFSAWQTASYTVVPRSNAWHDCLPKAMTDILNTVYLAHSDPETILEEMGAIYLELDIVFRSQEDKPDYYMTGPLHVYTSADGIYSNEEHTHAASGVVTYTDISSVDLGEFVQCPIINTTHISDIQYTHNGIECNHHQENDHGLAVVKSVYLN
jgi:hypothetical protein